MIASIKESTVEKTLQQRVKYLFEDDRLQTFKSWVFSNDKICNAKALAEAGFIHTNNKNFPDCVKCFLCEKELQHWEEDDDPWSEHKSHAPHCIFGQSKPQNEYTVKGLVQFHSTLLDIIVKQETKKCINNTLALLDKKYKK